MNSLGRVLEGYGLTQPLMCLQRVAGGRNNSVWLVGEPAQYVLRRYDSLGPAKAHISLQHDVMCYLARRSSLVAAPLAAARGDTYLEEDGYLWALFPFIPGTPGNAASATAIELSGALGRQHRLLLNFHAAAEPWQSDALSALEMCRRAALCFHGATVCAAIDWHRFAALCGMAQRVLESDAARLPRQIVHGDIHPANTIWQGGKLAGIIDFDHAHETERIHDLTAIIDTFARPNRHARIDRACAAAIVEAYDETGALCEAERRNIGAILMRRAAASAIEAQIDYEQRERKSAMFLDRMIEAHETWFT